MVLNFWLSPIFTLTHWLLLFVHITRRLYASAYSAKYSNLSYDEQVCGHICQMSLWNRYKSMALFKGLPLFDLVDQLIGASNIFLPRSQCIDYLPLSILWSTFLLTFQSLLLGEKPKLLKTILWFLLVSAFIDPW